MSWRGVNDPGGVGKLHVCIDNEGSGHMGIPEGGELTGGEAGGPIEEVGTLS